MNNLRILWIFTGLMKKVKGPLKIVYNNIENEIDEYEILIRVTQYRIYELMNNYNIHLAERADKLSEQFTKLHHFKNQIKILKENEKIIFSV